MIRGWREWFLEKSITSVNRNIFNIYIFNIYSIIGSTINYTIFLYDLILAERNFFFCNDSATNELRGIFRKRICQEVPIRIRERPTWPFYDELLRVPAISLKNSSPRADEKGIGGSVKRTRAREKQGCPVEFMYRQRGRELPSGRWNCPHCQRNGRSSPFPDVVRPRSTSSSDRATRFFIPSFFSRGKHKPGRSPN